MALATRRPKVLISGILLNYVGSALIAFLWPKCWLSRAFAFCGVFFWPQPSDKRCGWGLLLHSLYGFVFAGFIFIFLPREGALRRRGCLRTLSLFWLAQASLLTIYGVAGIWRLRVFIDSVWHDSYHMFRLDGLANMIIARTITSGEIGVLGDWAIRHPMIATLGFLFFSSVELLSFCDFGSPNVCVVGGALTLFILSSFGHEHQLS